MKYSVLTEHNRTLLWSAYMFSSSRRGQTVGFYVASITEYGNAPESISFTRRREYFRKPDAFATQNTNTQTKLTKAPNGQERFFVGGLDTDSPPMLRRRSEKCNSDRLFLPDALQILECRFKPLCGDRSFKAPIYQ